MYLLNIFFNFSHSFFLPYNLSHMSLINVLLKKFPAFSSTPPSAWLEWPLLSWNVYPHLCLSPFPVSFKDHLRYHLSQADLPPSLQQDGIPPSMLRPEHCAALSPDNYTLWCLFLIVSFYPHPRQQVLWKQKPCSFIWVISIALSITLV